MTFENDISMLRLCCLQRILELLDSRVDFRHGICLFYKFGKK